MAANPAATSGFQFDAAGVAGGASTIFTVACVEVEFPSSSVTVRVTVYVPGAANACARAAAVPFSVVPSPTANAYATIVPSRSTELAPSKAIDSPTRAEERLAVRRAIGGRPH